MTSDVRVSLVTPTCERPMGIRLMEEYMRRQTVSWHEWIVADGGTERASLTMGQQHLWVPSAPGMENLAANLEVALLTVTGDVVVFIEDDDFYFPTHVEDSVRLLRDADAAGARRLRYYNVFYRNWVEMANRGAALCQTSIQSDQIPRMLDAISKCRRARDYCIDGEFWSSVRNGNSHDGRTVVGIKGLPGTSGLGIGHRPFTGKKRGWSDDPGMHKLREWIGDAAANYEGDLV